MDATFSLFLHCCDDHRSLLRRARRKKPSSSLLAVATRYQIADGPCVAAAAEAVAVPVTMLPLALATVLAITDGPLSAGNHTLLRSLHNQLLRIARAPAESKLPLSNAHWATAARSYDGLAWESALDPLIAGVHVHSCSAKACVVQVPAINGTSFHLVEHNLTAVRRPSHLEPKYEAAKLLAQATYGPTLLDVARLSAKLVGPGARCRASWLNSVRSCGAAACGTSTTLAWRWRATPSRRPPT